MDTERKDTTVTTTTTIDHRAEVIRDLRTLADLLERYPQLPVAEYARADLQHSIVDRFGDEAARVAEVERIAAILGVDVERHDRGVRAVLNLGGAEYRVCTSTDRGSAAFWAERSYHGAVQP
jgi:hypothetical protein